MSGRQMKRDPNNSSSGNDSHGSAVGATKVADEKHNEKDEEKWNTDGLHDGEEEGSKIDVHIDAEDAGAGAVAAAAYTMDDVVIISHSTAIATTAGTRMSFVTTDQGNNKRAKATAKSSNKWELTPIPLLLPVMGYLDNATLMIMCLVCKQINEVIKNGQGMEPKLIREFEVRHVSEGREFFVRFLQKMKHWFEDDAKRTMLQGYHYLNIIYKTGNVNNSYFLIGHDELKILTQNIQMTGVLSLDASSQARITVPSHQFPLLRAILLCVPNLQRVNLSNLEFDEWMLTELLTNYCPKLEAIEWNNNTYSHYWMRANGRPLKPIANLKDLYFDDCCFHHDNNNNNNFVLGDEYEAMSTLTDHPNIFLFHELRDKPIERVSIRNARYNNWWNNYGDVERRGLLPQNMLLKFVRNAPKTLAWFRSDLSPSNIQLLQSEYPDITFVN